WFRPVDAKLGPDGAIYVADFYNRIIGHYEVPLNHPGRDRDSGRIWRIVWKGLDGKAPPPKRPYDDLGREPTPMLCNLLWKRNITVRMQAMNELAERLKNEELPAWERNPEFFWVRERLGTLQDASLVFALSDDPRLSVHVLRMLAERSR